MSKSTWEMKLNAFRKWGWSEELIKFAFMLNSQCMRQYEKKILTTMDYLVNQIGYSSLLIAICPVILNYSLENRIIPRCSVYRSLVSKGLIKKNQSCISSLICMSQKSFFVKYVIKYEQQSPELLKV